MARRLVELAPNKRERCASRATSTADARFIVLMLDLRVAFFTFHAFMGPGGMLGADGTLRACCVPSLVLNKSRSASPGEASGCNGLVETLFDWKGRPAAAAANPSRTPRRITSVAAFRMASIILGGVQ